jgi:predicted HNH restriction endonuclease
MTSFKINASYSNKEIAAGLCPNCHRRMHALRDPKDIKLLKELRKADSNPAAN